MSTTAAATMAILTLASSGPGSPRAHADERAYLVNVTVRSRYDFANAAGALECDNRLCDNIAHGRAVGQLVDQTNEACRTFDPYQAADSIGQTGNELCPALSCPLRSSTAGYLADAGSGAIL